MITTWVLKAGCLERPVLLQRLATILANVLEKRGNTIITCGGCPARRLLWCYGLEAESLGRLGRNLDQMCTYVARLISCITESNRVAATTFLASFAKMEFPHVFLLGAVKCIAQSPMHG
jgi:hypothetical protein